MSSLLNPVALITGAASGIGAACARDLARKASGGLILVDADEEGLAATADALPAAPERVSTLAFDVADAARWAQATDFINGQYGRLDWAIVNTANAPAGSTVEDWRHEIDANLDAAFLTMRSLMPLMRMNSEGGTIVITGPAESVTPEPGAPPKPGLMQLTRVAAKEGAADSVRVNAVAPSGPDAELWRAAPLFQDLVRDAGTVRAALERMAKQAIPLARYGDADDIAKLVVLLLTESAALTGATLVVEGGYTL